MSIATPSTGPLGLVARTSEVAEVLGGKSALARLLQVSPSQPTRWIDGSERPSTSNARTIVDLDFLIARASLVWDESVIPVWLNSPNAFLGGAKPLDSVKAHGFGPALDALDAEQSGAFA